MKKILILILFLVSCNNTKNTDNLSKTTNDDLPTKDTISLTEKVVQSDDLKEFRYRKLTDLKIFKDYTIISSVILDSDNSKSLSYLKNRDTHILALEEILESSSSKVRFMLLDTVHYNSNNPNIITDLNECKNIDDTKMKNIVAFSEYEDKEYFDKTLKAWRIDLINNKFELIDRNKVKCLNISFGYDE